MKTKTDKRHLSIHQRIERACHHRALLSFVVTFMLLGLMKYQTEMSAMFRGAYNQGFGFVSIYHHDEITRMPVQYGDNRRATLTSGE